METAPESLATISMGCQNGTMVPCPRYTTIANIPGQGRDGNYEVHSMGFDRITAGDSPTPWSPSRIVIQCSRKSTRRLLFRGADPKRPRRTGDVRRWLRTNLTHNPAY